MRILDKVFILGMSRTGSKFYMQLLNSHEDIFIAPEMLFKHPFKMDLFTIIEKAIKESKTDFDTITNCIFESNLKDTSISTINLIERNEFNSKLKILKEFNPFTIFDLILSLAAENKNKRKYGAKFPVHHSYLDEVKKNFKASKILYLIRDPRDIYTSDSSKKKKELENKRSNFPVKGFFLKFAVLLYTIKEWESSMSTYEKFIDKLSEKDIRLFKYENILINQVKVVNEIAGFLDIDMMKLSVDQLKIVDSSFDKIPSLNRWKTELNLLEKFIFKLLIGRKMKSYGYN